MPITVNGSELCDADIERMLPDYADMPNATRSATIALVLQRALLDEAERLGICAPSDEATIAALLDHEAAQTTPTVDEWKRYYDAHPDRFTVGELAEVDHILFQVTDHVNMAALRHVAESTLAELLNQPTLFAQRASELSNCPSGAVGGRIGQLGRGVCVPEFERAVFETAPGSLVPRLVETRFGLHIVRVARRVAGNLMPFEVVAERIAAALQAVNRDNVWRQYVFRLINGTHIEGIELESVMPPLTQ